MFFYLRVLTYANISGLKVKLRKCQDRGFETHPKTLAQYLRSGSTAADTVHTDTSTQ